MLLAPLGGGACQGQSKGQDQARRTHLARSAAGEFKRAFACICALKSAFTKLLCGPQPSAVRRLMFMAFLQGAAPVSSASEHISGPCGGLALGLMAVAMVIVICLVFCHVVRKRSLQVCFTQHTKLSHFVSHVFVGRVLAMLTIAPLTSASISTSPVALQAISTTCRNVRACVIGALTG